MVSPAPATFPPPSQMSVISRSAGGAPSGKSTSGLSTLILFLRIVGDTTSSPYALDQPRRRHNARGACRRLQVDMHMRIILPTMSIRDRAVRPGNVRVEGRPSLEALAEALVSWSRDGAPANPVGWLLATARRRKPSMARRG